MIVDRGQRQSLPGKPAIGVRARSALYDVVATDCVRCTRGLI